MTEEIQTNRLHLGAAYYPEHYPESRWPEDVRLMREAGMNVVRMAEFAWSTMEADEGQFVCPIPYGQNSPQPNLRRNHRRSRESRKWGA